MRDALTAIRNRLDSAGILISGLCLAHCLLGIVLVTLLGIGGGALLSPGIHEAGLALAIGIGVLTLGLGVLRHGRLAPLAIGACGIALMAAGLAVPHGFGEAALTVAGVSLVAFAHMRNLRHAC